MRSIAGCLAGLVLLAGCAEPTFYDRYKAGAPLQSFPYKAGATGASLTNDITNCEIEAAQRVPQNLASTTTPTYTTPTQTHCNRIGTQVFCNTTGGQTYGGQTTIFDANSGLRSRAQQQCMMRSGYRFLNVPACPDGVRPEALVVARNGGLPQVSAGTCYLVDPSGSWMIGNRT